MLQAQANHGVFQVVPVVDLANHDPASRDAVGRLGPWILATPPSEDLQALCLSGAWHVQLWHEPSRTSIISPCSATGSLWELRGCGGLRWRVQRPGLLEPLLRDLPGAPQISGAQLAQVQRWWVAGVEWQAIQAAN